MTNKSGPQNFAHLLQLRARHPNDVKETLGGRRTQGLSDLDKKRKLLPIHYEFQGTPGILEERTSMLPNTLLLNFVH